MRRMKSKFGREILWLSLPVVMLGGWAWWNIGSRSKVAESDAKIEVLEAAMFSPWFWGSFQIHLRHKDKQFWPVVAGKGARKLRLLDGKGREVVLWTKYDPIRRFDIFVGDRVPPNELHPNTPRSDAVVSILTHGAAPKKGWNSVPRPLWITGEVSDGECLPIPFKVRIVERPDQLKDFGAS